jgi:hypothetical protein
MFSNIENIEHSFTSLETLAKLNFVSITLLSLSDSIDRQRSCNNDDAIGITNYQIAMVNGYSADLN